MSNNARYYMIQIQLNYTTVLTNIFLLFFPLIMTLERMTIRNLHTPMIGALNFFQ